MLGGGKCSSPWGDYFDDYRRRDGLHAHPPGAPRPGVMLMASVRVQIITPPNALYRSDPICSRGDGRHCEAHARPSQKFAANGSYGIGEVRIKASESHDQYTTIVRSKPSQMVLNHPKSRRPQR